MDYRKSQIEKQKVIFKTELLGGKFNNKEYEFVLKDNNNNFAEQIEKEDILEYFKDNEIGWWKGQSPTGHTLSSQIACLNHLYAIRRDYDAVLAIVRKINNEFDGVEILTNDKPKWQGYISFEVVSKTDHLNEKKGKSKKLTRGSQCTSIDAVILATKKEKRILLTLEWKYVEKYGNDDKSMNSSKGNCGDTRLNRYCGSYNVVDANLIQNSTQLKNKENYRNSIYFFEPFYQLMRQTLWAEQMVRYQKDEIIKADDYINVHVVPIKNTQLRDKKYKCSGLDMYSTWKNQLTDPTKYVLISPDILMENLPEAFKELKEYLRNRYWL